VTADAGSPRRSASSSGLDGLLVVDKPPGPTSHDVVARVRRALGERRVGHTGTLDPAASGVLVLLVGRATRLARFLTAHDKAYVARVRLGVATDSADAEGRPIGARYSGPWPDLATIERALEAFRGTFAQRPPAYSAKKIDGRRSYKMARSARPGAAPIRLPQPSVVTLHDCAVSRIADDEVELHLTCSAGFYVRALASDIGEKLGTGAHLVGLRRTRCGPYRVEDAHALERVEQLTGQSDAVGGFVVPMREMLSDLPAVALSAEGVKCAARGGVIDTTDPATATNGPALPPFPARSAERSGPMESVAVRLLGPDGGLVAVGAPTTRAGLLHPFVVLI